MPKLIILRGNSGSGKTTVAKRLQHELGYETMLIQHDVVRREILRTRDTPGNPAIQMIYDMARCGHTLGYDVIIEGILPEDRYGDMLRRLMTLFDASFIYYFDIPLKETLRRHSTRPQLYEFGEEEMRQWWRERDYLGVEGEHMLAANETEDELVGRLVQDCRGIQKS